MEYIIYPLKGLLETLGWMAAIGFIAWLFYRYKVRAEERESEITMRALEKSENAEEVLRNMQKPRKSARKRLLARLTWGWCLSIAGLLLTVMPFVYGVLVTADEMYDWDDVLTEVGPLSFIGALPLGVGIGFLISYFVGKSTLKDDD